MNLPSRQWVVDGDASAVEPLDALYDIAKLLANRTGQRKMLLEILILVESKLGLERAAVRLLSPDGTELVVEAARDAQTALEPPAPSHEGVTGQVLQSGIAAVVSSPTLLPGHGPSEPLGQEVRGSESSLICVPISLGREVIGTLSAEFCSLLPDSSRTAKRALSVVATMIAHDARARRMAKIQRDSMQAENLRLRQALGEKFRPDHIIGNSRAMRDVYTRIHQVASSNATVLIRGESGTGKELVASALHYQSPRANKRLVKVNCAALSDELLLSELFGHEKGAFTGAHQTRIGRIEEAAGGTLFLDEIGDFSPSTQVKLLRVLQEREFQRVGSNRTIHADVRILCATNRNLEAAVEQRLFREDLYYRINVFPIVLPPLRERRDDILLLADHFVERYRQTSNKSVNRISTPAINMLFAYHWPGNVRELENCIEHGVLLSQDGVIREQHLPPTLQVPSAVSDGPPQSLSARTKSLERELVLDALKRHGGNAAAAARDLGITPRMVRYKAKHLGIVNLLARQQGSG